ncbi:MAG: MOSC N-terminal beta barrel domain-containing protein [Gammaproteobacteria bacterium]|nr:MOSC N-terminal beta barrel domain-containing protein [Gammaproteobacteria bacterium]MDE2262124.1 MOSC N-terminal beta barrel domain-containing protein [Gammaproteobacteria bacterium]
MAITILALNIYPLKSARGIPTTRVLLATTGFAWDRHWMVVREDGTFLTQRTHPSLTRISTQLTGEGLVLTAAGFEPLLLPLAPRGAARPVRIWKDSCEGLDQGDEAAAWVTGVLGEPVRAVRTPATPGRSANPEFAGPHLSPLAFPDGYPILVCNRASLDDLNGRLPEALPMERFRPNLVLEGLPPFAEDRIASIEIGPVILTLVKPCTRCIIPSTDQRTGIRGLDPLPVLRTFRFDRDLLGVTFGENAVITRGVGEFLELGAECRVTYEN